MQTYDYDDFTVTFRRAGTDRFAVQARAADGKGAVSEFAIPMSTARLEEVVVALGQARGRDVRPTQVVAAQATAEQLGGALATALFTPSVSECFDAARARATELGRGVRLILSLAETPELLSVPWELLYRRPTFLASQRRTPVVRYLETGRPLAPQRIEGAVRVLGVVASPRGLPVLDVADERRRVEEALEPMIERALVELDWCDPATPRRLRQQLRDGSYHILHYIGHSDFSATGDGLLFLVDDDGAAAQVTDAVLTNLLGDQSSLRLAILNSCEGARTTLTDPFAGIATSLVELGVPAVVAMQFTISDRAAIVFSEELFTSLIGRQYPIDAAVSEARKAVFTEVNEIEWATPVLFLRAADGRLFDFQQAPAVPLAPPSFPPLVPVPAVGRSESTVEPEGPALVPPSVPPEPPPVAPAGSPPSPEPDEPERPAAHRRSRRPFVAAGAAAAVAAIVVGVLVLWPDSPSSVGSSTTLPVDAVDTVGTAAGVTAVRPGSSTAPAEATTVIVTTPGTAATTVRVSPVERPECNGDPLPTAGFTVPPPADDAADVAILQYYFGLVAAASAGADNAAIAAKLADLYPATSLTASRLEDGYTEMAGAAVRWIAPDDGAGMLVGELVYDGATGSSPCRTGVLCYRAAVEGNQIVALRSLRHSDPAFARYPYHDGRWFGVGDPTPSARTAEQELVDRCATAA